MLIVFLWVAWIILVFRIFADVFRNHDTSGWVKAAWSIVVILFPFLGVLVYLIVHGGDMAKREQQASHVQQQAVDQYIRSAAGTSASTADELSKHRAA